MFTISSLTGGDTEVQRISLICLCTQPEKGDARSQTVQPRACAPPYFILFVSVLAAPGLHCSAKAVHGLLLRGTWGLSSPSPAPAACWSCSVAQLCLTLCDLMDGSTPGFPVSITISRSLLKLMSIESVMPSNHLILCHPLLHLPSIFPSIRVFSNEWALGIRWPKSWSFSFSISPFSEYSGSQ